MTFTSQIQNTFTILSDALFQKLSTGEELVVNLDAEQSVFIRFNNSRVRQHTHVQQIILALQLQNDSKTTSISLSLSGRSEEDLGRVLGALELARKECQQLPQDPYAVAVTNNGQSKSVFEGQLLSDDKTIDAILSESQGVDMAGLYCAGPIISANRNSKGQDHWFSTESFFMDYSLYNGEKAVKGLYAGTDWNQKDFARNLNESKNQLSLMDRPKKAVPRGEYRVYLAPAAVTEILPMFSWGALGYGDYRRGSSALKKLADKERSFSKLYSMRENFNVGLSPRFNALGELAPEVLELVTNGELKNFLVSSRSAKEFSVPGNNAGASEGPRALEVLPGSLSREDILKKLGTGLYLSNLHYLNWSDRQNARITGMTRYACFWVENGEIVAPIADLRFDESLYDCLGDNLEAVTDFQEVFPSTSTYDARSLGGLKTPGLLINNFKFTL